MSGLYGYQWQKARAVYLKANPLCTQCARRGLVVQARIVDHITPHRGDLTLFWDQDNWQSLCKPCHDSWKQAIEKGREAWGADDSGLPTSPAHHWNRLPGGRGG